MTITTGSSTRKDGIWKQLLLWRDLNHDGISQPNELTPVKDSGLTAIRLDYHWTGRRDASGNYFRHKAEVTIQAAANQPTPRPVYDIFFTRVP